MSGARRYSIVEGVAIADLKKRPRRSLQEIELNPWHERDPMVGTVHTIIRLDKKKLSHGAHSSPPSVLHMIQYPLCCLLFSGVSACSLAPH